MADNSVPEGLEPTGATPKTIPEMRDLLAQASATIEVQGWGKGNGIPRETLDGISRVQSNINRVRAALEQIDEAADLDEWKRARAVLSLQSLSNFTDRVIATSYAIIELVRGRDYDLDTWQLGVCGMLAQSLLDAAGRGFSPVDARQALAEIFKIPEGPVAREEAEAMAANDPSIVAEY